MRSLFRIPLFIATASQLYAQTSECNFLETKSASFLVTEELGYTSHGLNSCSGKNDQTVHVFLPIHNTFNAAHNDWQFKANQLKEPELKLTSETWGMTTTPTDVQISREIFERSVLSFDSQLITLNQMTLAGPGIQTGNLDIDINATSERHYGLSWRQGLYKDLSVVLAVADNRWQTRFEGNSFSGQYSQVSEQLDLSLKMVNSNGSGTLTNDYQQLTLSWYKPHHRVDYRWLTTELQANARLYLPDDNIRLSTSGNANIQWHQLSYAWSVQHWQASMNANYAELNAENFLRARVGLLTVGGSDITVDGANAIWLQPRITYAYRYEIVGFHFSVAQLIPLHIDFTALENLPDDETSELANSTTSFNNAKDFIFGAGLSAQFTLSYLF